MEYRTILECTLEDIVTVLNDPDWPAAELILQVFSKILVACIDSDTGDSYLRMMAIEWLGIIVDRIKTGYSHVAGVQGSYTPEWLYQLNKLIPHQLDEQGKAGYHLMDCCRMKLYQALLEESSDKNIAQFYLMSWGYSTTSIWRTFQERLLDDSEKNDNQNDTGISSDLAAFLQSSCHRYWFLGLDVDCAMPDMTRYDFPELNRDDLQMIAELLATQVITFRVMALRALGQIAANSPEIWEEVHLHKAVIQRIYDVSPKVRDAAVELTASYLANQQVISRNLYEILSSRIMDTAPNVRKRIVKLLPDLYYKCDDEDIKIDIAAKLLQRMDDNEAPIRKLALKLTQQVLLLPFHQFDQDDSGNPFNNSTKIRKQKVTDWTNLITSTVAKLGGSASGRNMVLTRFVQETLDIADDKQRQRYERIFQWIVDCLFEKMLTFDETGKNREFIHCMATIHAFVKACPSLLNDTQIYTLLPYLSVSESDDWTIGKYVMVLYRDVLPRIKYRDLDFARMVEGVLLQALARCPNYVIEDAASCLCAVVANISHRYQILIKMLGSCLASLGQDQQHIINHRTIQRPTKTAKALMICGLLCQHFDFDEKRLNEGNKMGQLDAIYKGKINSYVFAKLQYFTGDILDNKIINKQIKLAAIKALGSLYSSHPTFMMTSQSTDLLDSIFVQDDIDMKVQILNVFQGFLTTEETRMQKRSEASGATLYNKVIDVETLLGNTEEFAELGANGSLMQRYLPSILKCTLGSTNQLRLSAFDVIETVINQGLAHPMMCMPAIVSAETSSDLPLRNKAYYLHIYIHNKFGSILYSQMDANLKAAFRYQELLCGKYNVKGYGRRTGENNSEDALLAVTYGVLKEKKNARMDFLNNMVKPFNIDMKEAKQSDILDINYLKFLADNLLTLPLTTSDELLFVLHCMDRIIVTAGGYTLSLVQQFKKEGVISTLSYMDDDDDDDDNGLDQDYAITAKAAIAMNILILTKDKLVSLYNIDEQQIQSYVLYGKNKSYDIIKDTEENGLVDWTELAFFRLNKLTSFTASDACLSLEKRMDECDTSSLIG
ncbi:sister chromatid cohesion C-terminus-domain-containing protein [Halteromyces radiatus]|uniref:sister chromatid cohesion C-terminus-domain-containing protein n=1 Tax=Halteromyces radiatus TaxID=101107 RepID=UPI002220AC13|nr:sister chromatid cohesion C-terminus-domain-containing protein [Halteromyces radiatus]KAI8093004.1 sister chromatid cohesion C-terminus-domain-containing protein [Halteromyces radiatus]